MSRKSETNNVINLPSSQLSTGLGSVSFLESMMVKANRAAVTTFSPLLPRDDCRLIIERVDVSSRPHPHEAVDCAIKLLSMYRKTDYQDPDAFGQGLALMFKEYPLDICLKVVHPVLGLPAKLKFAPTIADVREALEGEVGERRGAIWQAKLMLKERDRREKEAEEEAQIKAITPEKRAEMAEKLKGLSLSFGGSAA